MAGQLVDLRAGPVQLTDKLVDERVLHGGIDALLEHVGKAHHGRYLAAAAMAPACAAVRSSGALAMPSAPQANARAER